MRRIIGFPALGQELVLEPVGELHVARRKNSDQRIHFLLRYSHAFEFHLPVGHFVRHVDIQRFTDRRVVLLCRGYPFRIPGIGPFLLIPLRLPGRGVRDRDRRFRGYVAVCHDLGITFTEYGPCLFVERPFEILVTDIITAAGLHVAVRAAHEMIVQRTLALRGVHAYRLQQVVHRIGRGEQKFDVPSFRHARPPAHRSVRCYRVSAFSVIRTVPYARPCWLLSAPGATAYYAPVALRPPGLSRQPPGHSARPPDRLQGR